MSDILENKLGAPVLISVQREYRHVLYQSPHNFHIRSNRKTARLPIVLSNQGSDRSLETKICRKVESMNEVIVPPRQ